MLNKVWGGAISKPESRHLFILVGTIMQFHVSFLKVLSNVVWEDGWQKIQLGKSFLTVTEWHGGGGVGGVCRLHWWPRLL